MRRRGALVPIRRILVCMLTYGRNHGRLVDSAGWLSDTYHIIYTDTPLGATGHSWVKKTLKLNVKVQQGGLQGLRFHDWVGQNAGDMRAVNALADANASYAGTFRWLVLVDDDTMLFMKKLQKVLFRVDHRSPFLLGSVIEQYGDKLNEGVAGWPAANCTPRSHRWNATLQKRLPCHFLCDVSEPCPISWTPPSSCTLKENGLDANSSALCSFDRMGDGRPIEYTACRECFCPVRAEQVGSKRHYRLDFEHGQASLTPALAFPYGGLGIVVSQGLVDAMPAAAWYNCAAKLKCGPSDFRVATCVQNVAGIGASRVPSDWYTAPWPWQGFFNQSEDAMNDHLDQSQADNWPISFHKAGNLTRFLHAAFVRARRRRVAGGAALMSAREGDDLDWLVSRSRVRPVS